MRDVRTLHDGWRLHLEQPGEGAPADVTGLDLTATVPGCVHTDLLAAGRLADPDIGLNAQDQTWVGRSVWRYATTFGWTLGETDDQVDLVFDGLDTVAEVRLNGDLLGATQNMHRSHRFGVADRLRAGDNTLEIVFASVFDLVEDVRAEVGELPSPAPGPQGYVRKMGANFGTDWVPPLTTAGIWRPVRLERWSDARIDGFRPQVSLEADGRADVAVDVDVVTAGPGPHTVRLSLDGRSVTAPVQDGRAHLTVVVDSPRLWWPVGHGEPHRYPVEVELQAGERPVDRQTRRVGLRTVAVVEEPDEVGRRWALHVNGRPIRIRGCDWICDDPFPARVGPERYRRRIEQALAAHANLLRVWGGATYEADTFYEVCDERGVLVWQDFMFSAATYPETVGFAAEVEAEAREVVTRLTAHPSVVVWNGNNECVWGYHDWGWRPILAGRPWGARYYLDVLPRIVAELAPATPYVPGSPWSGSLEHPPNDPAYGVTHLWEVWNTLDYPHYRDSAPGFVPELGWCGPPAWATLRRAVPDGPLLPDHPVVAYHLRAEDGPAKLARGLADHFWPATEPAHWHYLAQVVQARAMTVAVDHLRGLKRCSGVVLWQLQDCWPVISWSMIDADGYRKPVWYAVRAAYAPRRVTAQPNVGGLDLVVVNDERTDWSPRVEVARVRLDGTVLATQTLELTCPPDAVRRRALPAVLAVAEDPRRELLVLDAAGRRSTWFWARDRDLAYPPARYTVSAVAVPDGMAVTVRAETLLADLALFPDRLSGPDGSPLGPEAAVDDMLITLLPGEQHTFHVAGAQPRHGAALSTPPVLRCVNDTTSEEAPDGLA